MKHRIWVRRRDNVRQRYWVGKQLRISFGSFGTGKRPSGIIDSSEGRIVLKFQDQAEDMKRQMIEKGWNAEIKEEPDKFGLTKYVVYYKMSKNYGSSKLSRLMEKKTIAVPVAHGIPGYDLAAPSRFSVIDSPYDYKIQEVILKKPISKSAANKLHKLPIGVYIVEHGDLPMTSFDADIERSIAKERFKKKIGLPSKRVGSMLNEYVERRNEQNAHRGLRRMLRENYGSFSAEGHNEDVAESRRLAMKMKTPEAALRAVRSTFDKPEDLECVGASCALLDPIKKFYPDAELARLSVKMPGTDSTNSHTVIISDKANKIIDSQVGQFKGRLKLPNNFIDKGIYNINEYSKKVPFAYAERIDDDKRIDLFKILKSHGG